MAGEIRRGRLKGLPINRMIPNILTLLALAAGLSAIRWALQERWELAVFALVAAGVLDALDGRIARILKGATRFGAELDSLSDFLCFGVAPALTLYLWTLVDAGRFGWFLVLGYCVCCALRLARFNTAIDAPPPTAWERGFFMGVPSPAGAGLVLLPMIIWFQTDWPELRTPWAVAPGMVLVAGLLVSQVRTFTFKKVHIPHKWVLPTMLLAGLSLALLLSAPWITLLTVAFAYLASIPFSVREYARLRRLNEAEASGAAGTPPDESAPPPIDIRAGRPGG